MWGAKDKMQGLAKMPVFLEMFQGDGPPGQLMPANIDKFLQTVEDANLPLPPPDCALAKAILPSAASCRLLVHLTAK